MKLITAYFISILFMAVGDSFWNNLPMLITAIGAVGVSVIGAIKSHKASVSAKEAKDEILKTKVTLDKVAVDVDGKMEEMLKLSREKFHAQGVKEATDLSDKIAAAKNEGELIVLKNAVLLNTTPPPTKPVVEEISADDIAKKVVAHATPVINEIADRVVEKIKTPPEA